MAVTKVVANFLFEKVVERHSDRIQFSSGRKGAREFGTVGQNKRYTISLSDADGSDPVA